MMHGAVSWDQMLPWREMAPALHPQEIAHLATLARAIGFHPEDLGAHRMGEWSKRDRLRRLGIGAAVLAFVGGPMVLFAALTTSSVERFLMMVAFMLPIPAVASAIIVFPAVFGADVYAVDGYVTLSGKYESSESGSGGSSIVFQDYVNVNGESFKVDRSVAAAIWKGRPYRVYVASSGKRLMSMEPIPAVAAPPYSGPRHG